MRSFLQLCSAALDEKRAALRARKPFRGHFMVTVDEFIEIATHTAQYDAETAALAGLPLGVLPNDWKVELAHQREA
jgi:hypothetical protein